VAGFVVEDLDLDPCGGGGGGGGGAAAGGGAGPAAAPARCAAGPLGVGTTFQLRQRFLARHLDVVLEVVRYEPGPVITVTTTSSRILFMTGTRLVEPAGDATRLTFLGTGHVRGSLKPLEPLLAVAAGAHRLRTQLGRLKQCLEAQP
jgi:hypothetical protein